jgi:Tyrosine-protein kinase ephrin type A/B receptor-like/Secretion system C-terminal sorting domain
MKKQSNTHFHLRIMHFFGILLFSFSTQLTAQNDFSDKPTNLPPSVSGGFSWAWSSISTEKSAWINALEVQKEARVISPLATCPAGQYLDGSTCTTCPVGNFCPGNDMQLLCMAGTYQDETGKSNCKICATGTATGYVDGSTFCPPCAAGKFASFEGSAACQDCEEGKYQPSTGQTTCLSCPQGKYASTRGNITCTDCPSGFTTVGTGADNAALCTVVLPLEMVDFKATVHQSVVQLRWQTAQEKNVSFYRVQRSDDGKDWTTIARTDAKGNTTQLTEYVAADPFPNSGVTFYRIMSYDFDGTTHFSKVLSVELATKTAFKVYPNPTQNQLNVAHATEKIKSVEILNLMGQILLVTTFEGTYIGALDTSGIPSGQHILRVYTEGGIFVEKIVKQ